MQKKVFVIIVAAVALIGVIFGILAAMPHINGEIERLRIKSATYKTLYKEEKELAELAESVGRDPSVHERDSDNSFYRWNDYSLQLYDVVTRSEIFTWISVCLLVSDLLFFVIFRKKTY